MKRAHTIAILAILLIATAIVIGVIAALFYADVYTPFCGSDIARHEVPCE